MRQQWEAGPRQGRTSIVLVPWKVTKPPQASEFGWRGGETVARVNRNVNRVRRVSGEKLKGWLMKNKGTKAKT